MKIITKRPNAPVAKFECSRCRCEWTDDKARVPPGMGDMGVGAESGCPSCGNVEEACG